MEASQAVVLVIDVKHSCFVLQLQFSICICICIYPAHRRAAGMFSATVDRCQVNQNGMMVAGMFSDMHLRLCPVVKGD